MEMSWANKGQTIKHWGSCASSSFAVARSCKNFNTSYNTETHETYVSPTTLPCEHVCWNFRKTRVPCCTKGIETGDKLGDSRGPFRPYLDAVKKMQILRTKTSDFLLFPVPSEFHQVAKKDFMSRWISGSDIFTMETGNSWNFPPKDTRTSYMIM